MRLLLLLSLSFSVLFCSVGHSQVCLDERYVDSLFEVTKTYNIQYQQAKPYGSIIELPYLLDIYEPTSDTLTYRPLVVFQFGGGYLIGDKLNPPANAYCSYWAERGYIAVSINYRLGFNTLLGGSAERAVFRGVQDLQAALRFLVDNKNTYGIDTSRIIAAGNSAGAVSTFHGIFMDADQIPPSISGFGFGFDADDLGGPYDSGNSNFNNDEVVVDAAILCWGGMQDLSYIGDRPDDCIPSILFHGSDDSVMHYSSGTPFGFPAFPVMYGSQPIDVQMTNTGIVHKFITFIGAGHEPEILNPTYLDTVLDESGKFIYTNLLKPGIDTVVGNVNTAIGQSEVYDVTLNQPFGHMCVNLVNGNGTISSIVGNQVVINWTTDGTDSIQFIVANDIDAFDTSWVAINISTSLSVSTDYLPQSFSVYPNPFSESTVVSFSSEVEIESVVITDVIGNEVKSFLVNSNSAQLEVDLSKEGSGIYFCKLISDGRIVQSKKILLKR